MKRTKNFKLSTVVVIYILISILFFVGILLTWGYFTATSLLQSEVRASLRQKQLTVEMILQNQFNHLSEAVITLNKDIEDSLPANLESEGQLEDAIWRILESKEENHLDFVIVHLEEKDLLGSINLSLFDIERLPQHILENELSIYWSNTILALGEEGADLTVFVKAAKMINASSGEVLGMVFGGIILNNNFSLLQSISERARSEEIVFFIDGKMIASTVRYDEDETRNFENFVKKILVQQGEKISSEFYSFPEGYNISVNRVTIGHTPTSLEVAIVIPAASRISLIKSYLAKGFVIGLLLLLYILLTLFFVRKTTFRPLERLIDYCGEVASGNLDVRHQEGTVREFNLVGKTIEEMVGTLKESHKELLHEVTERKKVQEELTHLNQYRESIIDNANIWLNVLDEKGKVVIWNKAAETISGFSRAEVIGNGAIWEWLYPDSDYRNEITQKAASIIEGDSVNGFETEILCKDGEHKTISWYSRNLIDKDGGTVGSIALGLDFTRRNKAEKALREAHEELEKKVEQRTRAYRRAKEEAEQANLAKSEFLANVSHELRNPMHQILSYSKYGIDKIDASKEKLLHYFSQARKAAERLMVLVDDLLDLSKMESGKMEYEFEACNLYQMISEVTAEFEPALVEKNLSILLEPPVLSTDARCDYYKLAQVIRNLLSNAVKFSPEGKTITIRISAGPLSEETGFHKDLQVAIRDQGVGIPEKETGLVFEKFTQSSKTKTGAGGTGLGLAICYEIIKAHEGRIWVANNSEGGATFYFSIPLTA